MVLGPDHSRLSKRHGATSVAEFKAKGYLPEALVNYLALLGWSPGEDQELLPIEELARRFSVDSLVLSAAVFDTEKLDWVNRHYLKTTDTLRLASLAVPFFRAAGIKMSPDSEGLAFLSFVMPIASDSVDRLDQVPGRLGFLFDYSPGTVLSDPKVREEMRTAGARAVVTSLVEVLDQAPRLDRDAFRAAANEIKKMTGQKGRGLFHPIRVALMGRPEGPELDLSVPAIDRGADLPESSGVPPIIGNRERARAFASALSLA
jgi:glutamyl/glutaminyl-tRNA synthetase